MDAQTQIQTQIQTQDRLRNVRDLQGMLLQEAGRTTTVNPVDPAKIGPAYDFGSIFRDAGQEAFYTKAGPYAQGGIVDTNEELLRLIGGK